MAEDTLTLDALLDVLCVYRQTLSGETPIALSMAGYHGAMPAGLVGARYLEPRSAWTWMGDQTLPGAPLRKMPLHPIAPLGDRGLVGPAARVALVLFPGGTPVAAPRAAEQDHTESAQEAALEALVHGAIQATARIDGAWPEALEVDHE